MNHGNLTLDQIFTFLKQTKTIGNEDQSAVEQQIKQLELGGAVQCYLQMGKFHYKVTPFGNKLCDALIQSYNDYFKVLEDDSTS